MFKNLRWRQITRPHRSAYVTPDEYIYIMYNTSYEGLEKVEKGDYIKEIENEDSTINLI